MTSPLEARYKAEFAGFWLNKAAQFAKQRASGKSDAGTRGSVTGGAHLDGFAALLEDVFVENGWPRHCISRTRGGELPGYYRPTKRWDLVVRDGDVLVAAIELKSQAGSFGNNFNNRAEEAIGNAVDLRRAYQAGLLGEVRPWLGYFFLLEESARSSAPVSVAKTPFTADELFAGTSYKQRYQILCQRLIGDGHYDAACLVTSSREPGSDFHEPDPSLSFAAFVAAIGERTSYLRTLDNRLSQLPSPGTRERRVT